MTWKRRIAPGLTAAHWWATGATNSLCGLVTSAGIWEATDAPGCGKCEEKIRRSDAMLAKLVPEVTPTIRPVQTLADIRTRLDEVERERDEWQRLAQAEARDHLATTKRLIETEAALAAARAAIRTELANE